MSLGCLEGHAWRLVLRIDSGSLRRGSPGAIKARRGNLISYVPSTALPLSMACST